MWGIFGDLSLVDTVRPAGLRSARQRGDVSWHGRVAAAHLQSLRISVRHVRPEKPGPLRVPGDALAPEIAEVGGEWCRFGGVPDAASLDRHEPRAAGEQVVHPRGGATATCCVSR